MRNPFDLFKKLMATSGIAWNNFVVYMVIHVYNSLVHDTSGHGYKQRKEFSEVAWAQH